MGMPYLRADENILYGGTVSGGAAATYDDDWLVDGRNRPAKGGTSIAWTATGTSGPANLGAGFVAVVHSHNIDAGKNVGIGGHLSGVGVALAARTNNIPVDLWIPATPRTTLPGTVSITVSGNSTAVTIGELIAGPIRTFTNDLMIDAANIGYLPVGTVEPQGSGGSVRPYARGLVARFVRGDIILETLAERDAIMDWYESTREGQKPSAIQPFPERNEALTVDFGEPPTLRTLGGGIWAGTLVFHEWIRKEWP